MTNISKDDRVAGILERWQRQGWTEHSDLSSRLLSRDNIDHFVTALVQAAELIRWQIGVEDMHGGHPNDDALIVQTLHRLSAELGRIRDNVHSSLLYQEESTRSNYRGSDPSIRLLNIYVGLFARYFGTDFASRNQRNLHIQKLIAAGGKTMSVTAAAKMVERFERNTEEKKPRHDWTNEDKAMFTLLTREIETALNDTSLEQPNDTDSVEQENKSVRIRARIRESLERSIVRAAEVAASLVTYQEKSGRPREKRLRKRGG